MLLGLADLLTRGEVATLAKLSETVSFVDGGVSAPALSRRGVKKNQEMLRRGPGVQVVRETVLGALERNETFKTAALPQRIHDPILSRYVVGQRYDTHIDQPLQYGKGGKEPFRLDLSITIFLSAPDSYKGGELVIDTGYGEKTIKLPAGHGILYPTTMLHRVSEVTWGTRLAAVTWIQSLVAEQSQRTIIYDIAVVTQFLQTKHPQSEPYHKLHNAYSNLIRQWATA